MESTVDAKGKKPAPPLIILFEHIYENSKLYYILLKSEKSSRIVERIRKISTEAITYFVETKTKTDPIPFLFKVPIEFFAAFFSGALISAVDWWLEEDMRHTPREMANLFQSLLIRGAPDAVGMPTNQHSKQKRSPAQPLR